jgi:hypothetical protein
LHVAPTTKRRQGETASAEHPRAVCIYFGWHFARLRTAMSAVVIAKAIAMRGRRRRAVIMQPNATQPNPTNHRSKKKPERRIDSHVVLPSRFSWPPLSG